MASLNSNSERNGMNTDIIITNGDLEMQEIDVKNNNQDEDDSKPEYGVNESPPIGLAIFNALQHFLICIDGPMIMPLLIFNVICFDDSPDSNYYKTRIIGSYFFLAGLVSVLQTTIGVRLPTSQIVAIAYFVPVLTVFKNERWACPKSVLDDLSNVNTSSNYSSATVLGYTSTSYVYLDNNGTLVSSTELWQRRMREIQGGILVSAAMEIVIGATGAVGFALRFIGPLTIAPSLFIAALTLLNLAKKFCSIHWGVSLTVVGIIVLFQYLWKVKVPMPDCGAKKRKCSTRKMPIFAMFPFVFALAAGWLVAYILTATDSLPLTNDKQRPHEARTDTMVDVVSNSPWISFPYPFQYGLPTLSSSMVIAMLAALVVGIADALCDFYATAKIIRHPSIPSHALNRGILVEGFGILLHGLVGTGNATTTFASNAVALSVSKVHSRRGIQIMGIMYMIFGILTKFCSVFVLIPKPVLGGQLFIVAGYIFSIAASTATFADLSNARNMFVLGFSVFIGLMFQMWVEDSPKAINVGSPEGDEVIRTLLGTGMLVAPIAACILDNTLPGSSESRGLVKWQHNEMGLGQKPDADESIYDLPFKTDWRWTRWFPICPMFSKRLES